MKKFSVVLALSFAVAIIFGSESLGTEIRPGGRAKLYTYKVVAAYPHDQEAFTQGLVFDNGFLYEGTGIKGRSTLRKVDLKTGTVLQLHNLPTLFFGEGVTVFGDKIIQLTWKSKVGLVYDKNSMKMLHFFTYEGEGWGLTHDGTNLIMSDGTDTIRFLHPETYEEVHQITVHDENGPVVRLNELEYINGSIYANVWTKDRIAIIDPRSGTVTGWVDLKGLLSRDPADKRYVDVLNGIAYDKKTRKLYVTGKLWPKLFQIELVEGLAK